MTKLTHVVILIVGLFVGALASAQTLLPLSIRGENPTPSILAGRIADSLEEKPDGTGNIFGANITPIGYLRAIQQAGGTVDSVEDLPPYLRSLDRRAMPPGILHLSAALPSGEVDLTQGVSRRASDGEDGWWDANTDHFILAGNCTNTPITPIRSIAQLAEPAVVQSVFPTRPVTKPYGEEVVKEPRQCVLPEPNAKYLMVRMVAPSAKDTRCAFVFAHDPSGTDRGNDPRSFEEAEARGMSYSRNCGFGNLLLRPLGSRVHDLQVTWEFEGNATVLFSGTVQGATLTPADPLSASLLFDVQEIPDPRLRGTVIRIPDQFSDSGWIVGHLGDYSQVLTPAPSGFGHRSSSLSVHPETGEVKECHIDFFSGIDAPDVTTGASVVR